MLQDEQSPLVSRFVLSQLPLEVRELRLGGRLIAGAVHPDFQGRIIGVGVSDRALQGLGHLRQLALRQNELVFLDGQLPFQDGGPLPVFGREPFRDRDGFGIGNLPREFTAPLGVPQMLLFQRELALGRRDAVTQVTDRHLGLDDRGLQGRCPRTPAQSFEHAQDFRTVLA